MPRIARIVAPGIPRHVTQRGNRRMETFFRNEDYQAYLALMAEWCRKGNVTVWACCRMPNHVHPLAVPESEEGLRLGIGEAHRRYSRMANRPQKWTGHLWEGRFSSFPMDESSVLAAVKYIGMNPGTGTSCCRTFSVGTGRKGSRQDSQPWANGTGTGRGHVSGLFERYAATNCQTTESGSKEKLG